MDNHENITVPEWASILGENEYRAFISAIEDYFRQKGEPYTIEDAVLRLGEKKEGEPPNSMPSPFSLPSQWEQFQMGLVNLAKMCAQNRPDTYPAIIASHFDTIMEIMAFEKQFSKIVDDFDQVKQYIGTKLHDKEYINVNADAFVYRPFAGEIYASLVYDSPYATKNIPKSDMEKWGKTEDEVFAIGIENIRRNYPLQAVKVNFGEDEIFAVEQNHFFAPNILFELEQHEEFIGKGGAIVAAPTRHMALIYPINNLKVTSVLGIFFHAVPDIFRNGPGSLSDEIYWYHDGQYEPLDYISDQNLVFKPSEAFLKLLNGGLE
ncbi:MAG: hypothetical protein FWH46_06865 [Methanimicrococcus sp.]|nr:hypothetical protein [Methanimicrococcus sp.]